MKTSRTLLFMAVAMTYTELAFTTPYGGTVMVFMTLLAASLSGIKGD